MAIMSFNQDKCTGCGICIACCPMDVLRLDTKTKKAVIKYPDDCIAGAVSLFVRRGASMFPRRGGGASW
jgi:NAD-dependent dihydropyrimidine dehydrogenase PreA subunit